MTNAKQQVVWRAEYTPFGQIKNQQAVPLTVASDTTRNNQSNGFISTANATTDHNAQKSFEFNLRFAGQYQDQETGYYYNWHRYYDPETGRYLTPDPIGLQGGQNAYAYANHDPMAAVDPWGLDAIAIVFPDYKISTPIGKIGSLGHAGILLINPKGVTRYYEYGRSSQGKADSCGCGAVRQKGVPNIIMQEGKPTSASLDRVLKAISKQSGHGGRVSGAYVENNNFEAMENYAKDRMAKNLDPKREPYDLTDNNCATFMKDTLEAGGVDTPWMIDPRPNSYINELRNKFKKVDLNGEKYELEK